jgi:hypothetical protein
MDQFKINDRFSIDQPDWNKHDETPTIRAAEKSDPAFLEAILAYYAANGNDESLPDPERHQTETLSPNYTISGAIHGHWVSPLTAAIRASLPHNVRLLAASADPNGIQLRDIEDY